MPPTAAPVALPVLPVPGGGDPGIVRGAAALDIVPTGRRERVPSETFMRAETFLPQIRASLDQAKHLLASEPRRPILQVAFNCGFNSLGPFNRAFKEATGITPTAFRNAGQAA